MLKKVIIFACAVFILPIGAVKAQTLDSRFDLQRNDDPFSETKTVSIGNLVSSMQAMIINCNDGLLEIKVITPYKFYPEINADMIHLKLAADKEIILDDSIETVGENPEGRAIALTALGLSEYKKAGRPAIDFIDAFAKAKKQIAVRVEGLGDSAMFFSARGSAPAAKKIRACLEE